MKPTRLFLVGFMGAGKSTVGRELARKLGWKFIDLDRAIERGEQRTVAEIFKNDGEPRFRELERQYLEKAVQRQRVVIALGGGAFEDPANRNIAEFHGLTIWLKASFATICARVKIDGTRPKFGNKEDAERLYSMRVPSYGLARFQVDVDDRTPLAVAEEILEMVQGV